MSCSKTPEIKVIKNESSNKLIYLSGAIAFFVSNRSIVIKTSQLAAKRPNVCLDYPMMFIFNNPKITKIIIDTDRKRRVKRSITLRSRL